MKVENMLGRNGNAVPNQFIIESNMGISFQSYDSVIAYIPNEGPTQLDRDKWDYSKTTSKYRNQFLGETTKETQAKIDTGEYILTDLN